jgi:hypothetical protein
MEKKQTILQFAMSNGAVLGITLIIISLLWYILGVMPDTLGKMLLIPLLNVVIVVVFVVVCTKNYRKKILNGFISFREAFQVGFLIILFTYIIRYFYDLVFNLIIDPGYVERVYESLINWMYDFYSRMGVPESQIDTYIGRYENQMANYTPLRAFFTGILSSAGLGAILSLITGAILKKEPLPFGKDEQQEQKNE